MLVQAAVRVWVAAWRLTAAVDRASTPPTWASILVALGAATITTLGGVVAAWIMTRGRAKEQDDARWLTLAERITDMEETLDAEPPPRAAPTSLHPTGGPRKPAARRKRS